MPAEFLCINEPFVGKFWEDKHVLDRPLKKKKKMKHETECVEKADYITKGSTTMNMPILQSFINVK